MEGFTQKEASLQTHALQFPLMAAGNDDNRRISGLTMAAQNFIERDTIQIWQTYVQQYQVDAQLWQMILCILPIAKKTQLPAPSAFQHIPKQVDQLNIIFNDSDQPLFFTFLLPIINNHELFPPSKFSPAFAHGDTFQLKLSDGHHALIPVCPLTESRCVLGTAQLLDIIHRFSIADMVTTGQLLNGRRIENTLRHLIDLLPHTSQGASWRELTKIWVG